MGLEGLKNKDFEEVQGPQRASAGLNDTSRLSNNDKHLYFKGEGLRLSKELAVMTSTISSVKPLHERDILSFCSPLFYSFNFLSCPTQGNL